ncbi:MAG TPA: MogA/MoaB family molybdenum cofactor biosynthesis protein [Anaerolineae bacterium]|nr:MogA/MoaB family molybdenum cofactor biosynthesis protein [Anaerolineae bacterium]
MRAAVLTISDRASRGDYEDKTGPQVIRRLQQQGWDVEKSVILPDDQDGIQVALIECCDQHKFDLVLTAGGTGFSARDCAPEATLSVVERLAPGLAEAMRAGSMKKTPHAMLSRAVAGIRGTTLIVNLPGSPRAAIENLDFILPALPHAVKILQGDPQAEREHRWKPPAHKI